MTWSVCGGRRPMLSWWTWLCLDSLWQLRITWWACYKIQILGPDLLSVIELRNLILKSKMILVPNQVWEILIWALCFSWILVIFCSFLLSLISLFSSCFTTPALCLHSYPWEKNFWRLSWQDSPPTAFGNLSSSLFSAIPHDSLTISILRLSPIHATFFFCCWHLLTVPSAENTCKLT